MIHRLLALARNAQTAQNETLHLAVVASQNWRDKTPSYRADLHKVKIYLDENALQVLVLTEQYLGYWLCVLGVQRGVLNVVKSFVSRPCLADAQ